MLHSPAVPPVVFPAAWQASCTAMSGDPAWAVGVTRPDGTIEIRLDRCTLIWRAQTGRLRNAYDVRDAAGAVMVVAHELAHKLLNVQDTDVTAQGESHAAADCAGWLIFDQTATDLHIKPAMVGKMDRFARLVGQPACRSIGL